MEIENIAGMEMPTPCAACGKWFDLNDGYACDDCNTIFCCECMDYGRQDKCPSHRPPKSKKGSHMPTTGKGAPLPIGDGFEFLNDNG